MYTIRCKANNVDHTAIANVLARVGLTGIIFDSNDNFDVSYHLDENDMNMGYISKLLKDLGVLVFPMPRDIDMKVSEQ